MRYTFRFPLLTSLQRSFSRVVVGLITTASLASAVELHLQNGDRITGDFVERRDGHIVFSSPLLGIIKVPEAMGVLVDAPETPVESLAGIPPAESMLPRSSDSPTPRTNSQEPKRGAWRGKVEFGFLQQTGRNDSLQASLRGEAERTSGPDNYRFEGRALYATQYERTSSDRYDGLFRFRHELSKRIFAQAQTSYTKDRVKLIEHNVEQNFGVGYKFIQRPRHEASIGGGLTGQYRKAEGIETGTNYLGELFQDYSYKLTGRMTITQDANLTYSPETRGRTTSIPPGGIAIDDSATNYRLRFNSALQGKVSDRISLNLRFEYEFDNAILDPKAKVDQRITSSIGYGF